MKRPHEADAPRLERDLRTLAELDLSSHFELHDSIVNNVPVSGEGRGGRIQGCELRDLGFGGRGLGGLTATDVLMVRVDLSAADLSRASLTRVRFVDCRLLGANLAEATLTGVAFENCTLELSNLRYGRLARVKFERCALEKVDFAHAQLADVRFVGSRLEGADLRGAKLDAVDLCGSHLRGLQGLASLRGATIDTGQLVELAPDLAADLGISVQDRGAGS
ncbi:MAG: pentapeptide repeat-containing protein [Candidatus Dormibacteria bacterium]